MTDRILLVLPRNPLTDRAKATFKPVIRPLQKAVICPTGRESTTEIHALDFGELEMADESFESNSVFEHDGNPLAGEGGATTPPARRLQPDRIGLVVGCWLPSRLVVHSLGCPLPGAGDPGLVATTPPG